MNSTTACPSTAPPRALAAGEWLELLALVQSVRGILRAELAEASDGPTHSFSPLALQALVLCGDAGAQGLWQSELAEGLGVSPAQASALVEELSSRALLAAHRPPHDRRRQYWRLTELGRQHLLAALGPLTPWAERCSARLGAAALAELLALLREFCRPARAPDFPRVAACEPDAPPSPPAKEHS